MLRITPIARAELRKMLDHLAPDGSEHQPLGFRLVPAPEGGDSLSLALDHPRSLDEVHLHEERKVLLLDRGISERMDGFTLDVADTPEGKKLTIR